MYTNVTKTTSMHFCFYSLLKCSKTVFLVHSEVSRFLAALTVIVFFTGKWASELLWGSVTPQFCSAQREEGLLQPEAEQQNWWAPSSSPSSLGKQHGTSQKTERHTGKANRQNSGEESEKENETHTKKAENANSWKVEKASAFLVKTGT